MCHLDAGSRCLGSVMVGARLSEGSHEVFVSQANGASIAFLNMPQQF